MKISAIFSDFDGTLSPLDVLRENARVLPETRTILEKIATIVPVCIITTKDVQFIREKVKFATALAGIGGLDIRLGKKKIIMPNLQDKLPVVASMLKHVKQKVKEIDENIYLEEKRINKTTVAFCIDWRLCKYPKTVEKKIEPLLQHCEQHGLLVSRHKKLWFSDISPVRIDKGIALLRLKKELKIKGPVMYMGDSKTDNPAFKLADVSIGVLHKRSSPSRLRCKYFVHFEDVGKFLKELFNRKLNFTPKLVQKQL